MITSRIDESVSYAIRIMPHAERDIEAHLVHLADISGAEIGRAWYDGLRDAIAQLAPVPYHQQKPAFSERNTAIPLPSHPTHGPAWRVLFTAQEGDADAPTVSILHVRHSAQKPITQAEARQIEFNP